MARAASSPCWSDLYDIASSHLVLLRFSRAIGARAKEAKALRICDCSLALALCLHSVDFCSSAVSYDQLICRVICFGRSQYVSDRLHVRRVFVLYITELVYCNILLSCMFHPMRDLARLLTTLATSASCQRSCWNVTCRPLVLIKLARQVMLCP